MMSWGYAMVLVGSKTIGAQQLSYRVYLQNKGYAYFYLEPVCSQTHKRMMAGI